MWNGKVDVGGVWESTRLSMGFIGMTGRKAARGECGEAMVVKGVGKGLRS